MLYKCTSAPVSPAIKDTKEESTEATHLLKDTDVKYTEATETNDVMTVTKRSSLHAYTVALALSVHSIFEGLALGLEGETSQV